jgi:hypothetical protein
MDPVSASTDLLVPTETCMDNDEIVQVEGSKCITQFKQEDVRAGEWPYTKKKRLIFS